LSHTNTQQSTVPSTPFDDKKYEGKIAGFTNLSKGVWELRISLSKPLLFRAGQYVWVVLEELKDCNELDRRSLSITSAEGQTDEITVLIRESSTKFKEALIARKIGSKITIYGPHGSSYAIEKNSTNDYVLLAGGVGVAPFISILRSLKDKKLSFNISLIVNKRIGDKLYNHELIEIAKTNPSITIKAYDSGLGSHHIPKFDPGKTKFFVCGPEDYVEQAYKLLKLKKVAKHDMAFEQHYPKPKNHKLIESVAEHISTVAKTDSLALLLHRQTSFFDDLRKRYFNKLMILIVLGPFAIIVAEYLLRPLAFPTPYSTVLWIFINIQAINLVYYLIFKNYRLAAIVAVNATAMTLFAYFINDQGENMDKAWLILPIAFMFFLFRRGLAIKNSIAYVIALCLTIVVINNFYPDYSFVDVNPKYALIFFVNTLAVILIFAALSKIIEQSEQTVNQRINAFNTLMRAVDNSTNHIIITDKNGVILYANTAATINTGYSREEMIGQTPRLWGSIMSKEFYKDLWDEERLKTISNREIVNRNKSGDLYYVNAHISPIKDKKNRTIGYIASESNITEIKKTQLKLADAKQRIDNIIKSTELGTWEWNVQTGQTIYNERWAEIAGYKLKELEPTTNDTWKNLVHPDDYKATQEALKKHFNKETKFFEHKSRIKHKDGGWVWVLDRGQVRTWIDDGEPEWMFGSHLDITKEQEIDQAKSEFVSLASHQLRTPLSTISWYTEIMLSDQDLKITDKQRRYLDEINEANKRMNELIKSLLNVSRLDLGTFNLDYSKLDIEKSAEQIIKEIRPLANKKQLELKINFAKNLPSIEYDKKYLEMIYQNLLSNAVKYTDEAGTIELGAKPVDVGEAIEDYKAPERGVLITVKDNGFGIPERQQVKIFNKLFRADNAKLKDTDGTGLGLYLLKRVVEYSNGNIWFKSKLKKGTTFFVFLPLKKDSPDLSDPK
jgi:PAS domain S-box-containing protein